MKRKMTIGLVMIALLTTLLWAGSLNPPAAPTAGTMKTLDQVEPRIPISAIPTVISQSGSYYLTRNYTCTTARAIEITAAVCLPVPVMAAEMSVIKVKMSKGK